MRIKYFIAIALSVASGFALRAQETIREMELLTVNDQITTVITATEPVRFVDISTDRVAGDQPLSNTVRLKPKRPCLHDAPAGGSYGQGRPPV